MAEGERGAGEGFDGQFGRDIEKYRSSRSEEEKGIRGDRGLAAFLGVMGAISMAVMFIAPPGVLAAVTLFGGAISLLAAATGAAGTISRLRRAEGLKSAEDLFRQADLRSTGQVSEDHAEQLRDYVEKSDKTKRSEGLCSEEKILGSSFLVLAAGFGGAALAGAGGPFGMAALGIAALMGAGGGASSLRDAARSGRVARERRAAAGEALRGLPEGLAPHTRPGYPEDFLPYSVPGQTVPPGGFVPADSSYENSHGLSARGGYVPEMEALGGQPNQGGYVPLHGERSAIGGIDLSEAVPSGTAPGPAQKSASVHGPATRLGRALEGVRGRRLPPTPKSTRPEGAAELRRGAPGGQRNKGSRGAG